MHRNPMGGHGRGFKIERLDKMVKAGRITEEEAAHLRAAEQAGELDVAIQAMQLKHARGRVDAARQSGRLAEADAQALLQRLDNGESPRLLRGLRHR